MERRLTRKQFLERASAAGAAGMLPGVLAAPEARRRRRSRPSVAIIGGGVAGLTAAHELAERGLAVTVYERRALGGKARGIPVPHSARGGRRRLPGEHGARAVFGWYHNLPDTLRRIPLGSGGRSVFDGLVEAPKIEFARSNGRPSFVAPLAIDRGSSKAWTPQEILFNTATFLTETTRVPADQVSYFVSRLGVFLSSCDERRSGEWEKVSWWDFIAASHFSEDYGKLFADSITGPLMAARSRQKAARATGLASEGLLYSLLGREDGDVDRVFDAPTNEAWIDAWVAHLRKLGVRFELEREAVGLVLDRGRVLAARLRTPHGFTHATADYFVCAVPAEWAKRLLDRKLLQADPALARIDSLTTHRYHGVQFFLRSPTPIVQGHILYVDSPWELVSISEAQFWARDLPRSYGDGSVRDVFSVDIGEFKRPGVVYGKTAAELSSPHQIAREVWQQCKQHLGGILRNDQVVRWFVDPGLVFHRRRPSTSDDQIFISTPGIWASRPTVRTSLPNLFLASDYVQVSSDLATMDGANEAARRAVHALLETAGVHATPPPVFTPYRPPEWDALKREDAQRYRAGQPNAFDVPPGAAPSGLRLQLDARRPSESLG